MSVDYYFVCDKCKEIGDNSLSHGLGGGYIDKDEVFNFLMRHFLERLCPVEGLRIVQEQSQEYSEYKNTYEGGQDE